MTGLSAKQCGADICPVYHLGQSQILSFWGPEDFIRRSRMLVGFMWGRWYLPLPRQHDIISVGGHPIKGDASSPAFTQTDCPSQRPSIPAAATVA